ncbi:MAG: hypothetical protein Q8O76_12025, partial [Chloroflexota bacterium]|nr:hypothetical protein [Chloroflexota bacterium]
MNRKLSASQKLWVEVFGLPGIPEVDEARVLAIVDSLPQRQALAVRLRFGFGGQRPLSLQKAGLRLARLRSGSMGVSRETARLEIKAALRRLRSAGLRRTWQEARRCPEPVEG